MRSSADASSHLTRRQLLAGLGASAFCCKASRLYADSKLTARLIVDPETRGVTLPANFTGLSYEAAQLVNPDFFSPTNHALIGLFRELGRRGVLRLGGGTSDYTVWTPSGVTGPAPFAVFGPDTSQGAKVDRPITPRAIRNLRGFLDATGWDLLYGLNMARGTAAAAAEEAAFVQQTIGPRLIAFQCGNEPDAWRTRYRPATFTFDDFFAEWLVFSAAVRGRVPDARFAGPDISNKIPWLIQFAERTHGRIALLTSHYYAEGPAGSPNATLDRLLAPNPKLITDLRVIEPAVHAAGVPWRMCEGNSCWDGGKPGVSDTFASALWCADMMLQFAQAGCAGVNLHGGGNGYYTPIAGDDRSGLVRRPEYYGMQFAGAFSGATLLASTLQCESDRVTAYAADQEDRRLLAVFNKLETSLSITVSGLPRHAPRRAPEVLAAPDIDSKDGVTLGASREISVASHGGNTLLLQLPPYRAALLRS
ncbi:MAG: hypothetical protein WBD46_20930 [Acidobacteriaceae bacterium]